MHPQYTQHPYCRDLHICLLLTPAGIGSGATCTWLLHCCSGTAAAAAASLAGGGLGTAPPLLRSTQDINLATHQTPITLIGCWDDQADAAPQIKLQPTELCNRGRDGIGTTDNRQLLWQLQSTLWQPGKLMDTHRHTETAKRNVRTDKGRNRAGIGQWAGVPLSASLCK